MKTRKGNWKKNYYLFSQQYKHFLCLFFLLSLFSCRTLLPIPHWLGLHKQGTFSGVATVEQKNKRDHFGLDIFISNPHNLRMDFSVSPWLSVFTLIQTKKEVVALFIQQREFYRGKAWKKSLAPLFAVDLDISILKEILFDRPPKGPRWKCKNSKKKLPISCKNGKWTISWLRKQDSHRQISIKSAEFNFTFLFSAFSSKVKSKMFNIKIPKHFKRILLTK